MLRAVQQRHTKLLIYGLFQKGRVLAQDAERNHQGLGNELLTPLPASANSAGPIVSRERLGGILNYYCRAA